MGELIWHLSAYQLVYILCNVHHFSAPPSPLSINSIKYYSIHSTPWLVSVSHIPSMSLWGKDGITPETDCKSVRC